MILRKKANFRGFCFCGESAGNAGRAGMKLHRAFVMENDGGGENTGQPKKQGDEISRMTTKKQQRKKEIISWIIALSSAVVLALALRFFVFEFVRVDGPSMENTLWTDEIVLVEKVSYHFAPPERFDIVFFNTRTEGTLVKRVIGLPGDKVEIKNFKLYVNDSEIKEDYILEPMDSDMEPIIVPEKTVFCMGDNRNVSQDSRSPSVGPVPYSDILGRGVFIVWPLDRISALPEIKATE